MILLAYGTLWFWLLIVTLSVSITALIENEYIVISDIVFVAGLAAIYFFGGASSIIELLILIKSHWVISSLCTIGYFVAGVIYSMIKWAVYLSDGRAKLLREDSYFHELEWKARENKNKIVHWGIYWPLSGLWTLISNPVVKIFNRLFDRLESVYQKMSDKIMSQFIEKKKAKEEFEKQQYRKNK